MSKLIYNEQDHRASYEDEDNCDYPLYWDENFTWTSREDYLAWVAEWKVCLKDFIKEIRDEKTKRRDKTLDIAKRNAANVARQYLRVQCYNLLLIRKIGKVRSAQQRTRQQQAA